jgi:hypothetical protein
VVYPRQQPVPSSSGKSLRGSVGSNLRSSMDEESPIRGDA